MLKRLLGILVTAGILVGCAAVPSLASGGSYDYSVYRGGKYIDSQFYQRGVNAVTAADSVKTTSFVQLQYGIGKFTGDSAKNKKGSYKLYSNYIIAKQIKSVWGDCCG